MADATDGSQRAPLDGHDLEAFHLAGLTGDAICAVDAKGRITYVNANLEALIGYDAGDIVGRFFPEFFLDDISAEWLEFSRRPTSVPEVGEFDLVRRDGSSLRVLLTVAALKGETFSGAVAVLRDISERVKAEQELARRERTLSALLANVTGMVYRSAVQSDGDVEFVSEGSVDLTGWSPDALAGATATVRYRDLIDDRDRSDVDRAVERAQVDGQPLALQYRIRHRDGSTRWVWDRARLVVADDRGPDSFEGIAMDITPFIDSRHAARASEKRFRQLVDEFPGGILVSQNSRIVLANRAAAALFRATPDALLGEEILDFVAHEDRDRATAAARSADPTNRSPVQRARYGIIDRAGERRQVEALHFATTFDDKPARQSVFWDITAAHRSNRIKQAHERVVNSMTAGDDLADTLMHIVDAIDELLPNRCAAFLRVDGMRLRYVAGAHRLDATFVELTDDLPLEPPQTPCARAIDDERPLVFEDVEAADLAPAVLTAARACGVRSWWSWPIFGSGQKALGTLSAFGNEIGEPRPDELAMIGQLRHLALIAIEHDEMRKGVADSQFDRLTGLANRALALEMLERELTDVRAGRGSGLAVMMLDLDDFSVLNETVGQEAGDEILRAVADLLATVVDRESTARFGSDSFLIRVRDETSEAALDELARRLQAALSAPFRASGREIYLSASVGIAVATDLHDLAVSLVASAEAALIHAKAAGPGGQRRLDDRLRTQARRRVELLPALRRAIENDELRLHYQPQIELTTGVVVGVEALVRWMHPTEGLLAPSEFIPAAESTGLILPLGGWALDEATKQAARWRDLRPERDLSVSLNVSARQLADPLLVERVEAALEASSIDPSRLRLELTETAVMADAASAELVLRRLRAVGVRLSIDDFGTGYSSLAYLQRFPVDELKIDGSFVAGLGRRAEDSAIVAATIRMAEGLGLTTVGEGVERLEQAAELARFGCDIGQGYLWMHPGPAEEIDAIVTDGVLAGAIRERSAGALTGSTVHVDADEALLLAIHELRTPLTVVSGYAELLEDSTLLPKARPAMQRAARRMEGILQSLADVAALDRGSLNLHVEEHKVLDVVRQIVDDAVTAGNDAVVSFEVDAARVEHDLVATFDRSRIEQVISNLITNALRYGPDDGRVRVIVGWDQAWWTCSVIDEGNGVSLDQAASIFRKYARADRRKSGTGIGLYLARGVARAHGGDLDYRRPDQGGTEFRLTLPLVS